ncbi:protein kinase domain-containing protein [Cyanobacterium sp. IPPAS B-1200]|uniref:serine/threonine-protein kinase n=1 Tax=Cyanobacterium sp. IPPAS B-1200 TaxID=1562720 RepID=UPI0008525A05|nr:serine/threonine-protein kinase [Cyanobacterium sp. IPPAS B-1200]OEJ79928.1 serine/threonine protein kinase [Cyanobacterium sp. IPPAS B-1200]
MIISYCVNPECPSPKNHPKLKNCNACGSNLILNRRYRVIKRLGKGGFGATFVGVDLINKDDPLCVVKQLRPIVDDPQAFKMALSLFKREAKTLAKINHPQIPKLLNHFVDDEKFYVIQELINGDNLQKEVKEKGVYGELGVKRFLAEITPILQYLHSQKVIHRDIKPANILRRKKDGKLILIDFGAVKDQVNTQLAQTYGQTALTQFAVGTMGYAPPEQMAMRPIYASDIYALGATCLYLLTGKSPKKFERDSDTGDIIWESEVNISPSFKKVLSKMLMPNVKERYKTADELLKALDVAPFEQSLNQSFVTVIQSTDKSSDDISTTDLSVTQTGDVTMSPTQQLRQAIQKRKKKTNTITIKWDDESFRAAYNGGKKDFSEQELNNINLTGVKLSKFIFRYAQLEGAIFIESNLAQSNFYSSNVQGANFSNANLAQAYFAKSELRDADFRGANLQGADFTNANLADTNFCGANLKNSKITQNQLKEAKVNWATVFPDGGRRWWKLF